jgi:hypothetical protein
LARVLLLDRDHHREVRLDHHGLLGQDHHDLLRQQEVRLDRHDLLRQEVQLDHLWLLHRLEGLQ